VLPSLAAQARAAVAAALRRFGWRGLGLVLCIALVVGAAVILYRRLHDVRAEEVMLALLATPITHLAAAACCVAAAYGTLALYDCFAVRTLGHRRVPLRIAVLAGFTSYAIGHNVGAATLAGGVIRYRVYSEIGLDAKEVAKVCFIAGLTFWLGNAFVLGTSTWIDPAALARVVLLPPGVLRVLAATTLAVLAAYVAWVWRLPRHAGINGFRVRLPGGPSTLVQIALGTVDLLCCAASLYLLLPEAPPIEFAALVAVFVAALLAGFASHVPAGLGPLDAIVVLGLPMFNGSALIASLVLFRLIYYLVPLALAVVIVGGRELVGLFAVLALRRSRGVVTGGVVQHNQSFTAATPPRGPLSRSRRSSRAASE
jgi:uncharacterized membrane protein YbhN (UPF0104 family)